VVVVNLVILHIIHTVLTVSINAKAQNITCSRKLSR